MRSCLPWLLISTTVPISVAPAAGDAYVDRGLFPEAFGILSSDRLMHPVDVANWPLRIGTRRQLLVDNYLIASMDNVRRRFHQPTKHPANPLIRADRPWEDNNSIIVLHVRHDPATGKFRMWYSTRLYYSLPGKPRIRFPTLYAESDDGITWRKPNLHLVEYAGSKANNFLIHGGRIAGLFENPQAAVPDERYLALVLHDPDYVQQEGYYLYKSPDGLRWTGDLQRCIIPSLQGYTMPQEGIGDTSMFRYDPLLGRYVGDVKFVLPHERLGRMRCRGMIESDDLIHWTRPRFTLYPDDHDDPDTQLYSNLSFVYESMWLGLLRVMHSERTGYKQVEVELSSSRDGRHWVRPDDRAPFLPLGNAASWDPDYTDPAHDRPLSVDDELWFYYRGARHRSRDRAAIGFKYSSMAVGLATLRRDGFASLTAGITPGSVVTRPLVWSGRALLVNAAIRAGGWVKAAALTVDGRPIATHTLADAVPLVHDTTRGRLVWRETDELAPVDGGHARLQFDLRNADLYSFWFE